MNIITFLQSQPPSGMVNMVFFLAIFGIMYFFFIRPAAKKQKAQENFASELTKGTEVVTSSGIIGRINKIEDKVVHLQIDQKTFIKVLRGAISKEMTEQYQK